MVSKCVGEGMGKFATWKHSAQSCGTGMEIREGSFPSPGDRSDPWVKSRSPALK